LKKKVLLVLPMYHPDGEKLLSREAKLIRTNNFNVNNLCNIITDIHALVVRAPAQVTGQVLRAGKMLEVVSGTEVGLNIIDVNAATEMGIPILYPPNAAADSVAEHALALLLAVAKKICLTDRKVREGDFGCRSWIRSIDLADKNIGIIGLGAVGSSMAAKCRYGLGMNVFVYDPYITEKKAQEMGITIFRSLEELLSQVDFLSLHMPLTPETRRFLSQKELSLLKPSAIIINTGHGGVLDEPALIKALREGRLAGAGLDVFDPEPPALDNPLLQMENVIVSPRTASLSEEATRRIAIKVAEGVLAVLRGERPDNVVNPQVFYQFPNCFSKKFGA